MPDPSRCPKCGARLFADEGFVCLSSSCQEPDEDENNAYDDIDITEDEANNEYDHD